MEPTTTGVATGTSLAIVALYLAHNLVLADVRYPFLRHRIERVHIGEDGLRIDTIRIDSLLDSEADGDGTVGFDEVLPCLRPFDALTQQLPDGTVPAIEAAKLELEYPEHFDWNTATVFDYGNMLIVSVDLPGYPKREQIYLHKDWDCLNYKQVNYLRSKHFAVGLPETAYIPL